MPWFVIWGELFLIYSIIKSLEMQIKPLEQYNKHSWGI